MTQSVRAADGRVLAYDCWGDPEGSPIFLLHGTPGSRGGPRPRTPELVYMGIRLIAYDRPGYGGSDRDPGRRVANAAADVAAVADRLGIERFAALGRSGGGPHALACAALLPDRVTAAASLVSPAPRHAEGLDWFAGMSAGNVRDFTAALRSLRDEAGPAILAAHLAQFTESLASLRFLEADLPEVDRLVLADPGIRRWLVQNFRHALAERNLVTVPDHPGVGPEGAPAALVGWIDDTLALIRRWGFRLDDIAVPVLIWHGVRDVFSPVAHAHWLADRIRDSTLVVDAEAAHFGALEVLPDVLVWLRRQSTGGSAPERSATAGTAPGRS